MRIDRFGFGRVEAHEIGNLVAKLYGLHPFGKVRNHRGENIPRMKSVTDRLAIIMHRVDVPHLHPLLAGINQGKHSVVRSHKIVPSRGQKNGTPCRAHARIDDHEVDGAVRKV